MRGRKKKEKEREKDVGWGKGEKKKRHAPAWVRWETLKSLVNFTEKHDFVNLHYLLPEF